MLMALLALVIGLGNLALVGVVLPDLWLWFVIPFGVSPFLGFWHAVGFGNLINFLTFRILTAEILAERAVEKPDKGIITVGKQFGTTVVILISWGLGYLYMRLM